MRRQVDHHLARARAIGRRASAHARATVWESAEAVQRAVDRLYEDVTVDMDDADETLLEYSDPADPDSTKRARLPKVTVRRR